MSATVLFRLSRGQLQAFEEALDAAKSDIEESWKSASLRATIAGNLRRIVRHSLEIPKTLNDLWHSTFDLIQAHLIDDYTTTGHELQEAFARGQRILATVTELVEAFERMGGSAEGAAELRAASEEVRRLETSVLQHWPWFTEQDLIDGLAEYERGECLDVTDAFAQIAGVDRETWLRRVEEYKRSKGS